jgi:alkyldihydroxyacetonephosphate synthase
VARAARIQGGALGPALERQLASHGLSLRFYPQSFEHSTLGGWLATRAGGHFATGWTHIDDLTEAIRMVTPRGPWQSRRLPASGAGPSPDRMVLGSEGILGVITEAWMRVRPRPRYRASTSARFADLASGFAALRALGQSDLMPTNCRLLDGREAMMNQVAFDGRTVVLVGFESADHPLGPWIDRAAAICRELGGEVAEPRLVEGDGRDATADRWRSAFLDGPYLFNALVSFGCVVDTFETAATWDKLPALDAAVRAAADQAMQEACGGGVLSCRVTHVYPDGAAPYYTFVAPGRRGGELEQHAAIKAAVSDALVAAGGTITHHHAVGRLHRPWYDRQRPALFAAALGAVKRELDPGGVMNPGVLIDQ